MYKKDLKALLHEITVKSLIGLLEDFDSVEQGLYFLDVTRADNELMQIEEVLHYNKELSVIVDAETDEVAFVEIELRLATTVLGELLVEHGKANFKYLTWNFVLPAEFLNAEKLTVDNCQDGQITFDEDEAEVYKEFGSLAECIGERI